MGYQSLYRKYRPQTFKDVAGQDAIVEALANQIKADRPAHAYLFTGTRGTGKTTVARIFAKALNCEHPAEDGSPCGECAMCRGISDGSLLNVIEIDGASNNGIDGVRTIIDEISYSPQQGKKKVYIIDEVHMLAAGQGAAFNALLKTLEEPPSYAVFILATTEVGKVPVTILSRCQRYDFHRMSADVLEARMRYVIDAEGAEAEDRALAFIARAADGSMRDALSLLDQCLAFHPGKPLTYEGTLDVLGAVDTSVHERMMSAISGERLSDAILLLDEIVMKGREVQTFVADFIKYMRNLLLISANGATSADIADVLGVSADTYAGMKKAAAKTDSETLIRYIRILSELMGEIRYSAQKKVLTEIAIIKMMHPVMQDDPATIKQRMAALERKMDKLEREGVSVRAVKETAPARKAPLPAALPDDVKLVCSGWDRIVKDATTGIKSILEMARPSVEGEKLVIVCDTDVAADMLKRNSSDVDAILEREIKKKVAYIVYGPGRDEDSETKYPVIDSLLNFDDIEIVDDVDAVAEEERIPDAVSADATSQDATAVSDDATDTSADVDVSETADVRDSAAEAAGAEDAATGGDDAESAHPESGDDADDDDDDDDDDRYDDEYDYEENDDDEDIEDTGEE